MALCIAILGLFSRRFTNNGIRKGRAGTTGLVGLHDSLALAG